MKYLASTLQKFEGHQNLGISEKVSKKKESKMTQKLNVICDSAIESFDRKRTLYINREST